MASEFEHIEGLHRLFASEQNDVVLGIGDDAAVLRGCPGSEGGRLVWTVDSCVEDVHFNRRIASWEDVGWRSFMAAASDLAAMGARPMGALSALSLPRDLDAESIFALARGQRQAADAIQTAVIGGNLTQGDKVSVHTTLLGRVDEPVLRSGAAPGHVLAVAGEVGLAALGLRLLLRGEEVRCPEAVRAWRRPVALVAVGRACEGRASSMIDVSDGLAQDAGHLAKASGVRINIHEGAAVWGKLEQARERCGEFDLVQCALAGGEDYALLATFADGALVPGFREIGRCESGEGVWLGGTRIDQAGFDHFVSREA